MTSHPIAIHFVQGLAQGQYEAVASACEQEIAVHPDRLTNYWYLGLARLLQGDEAEAQSVWLAATTVAEPEELEAGMAELADLLWAEVDRQLQQGRPDVAERICWQLIEIDPDPGKSYLQLGRVIALQARFEAAIEHWQTVLTFQPDVAEAYQRQGEVWQVLEQWDEAIVAYSQAIELQSSWEIHYQLGICLGQQAQWSAALEQFEQALSLNPDFRSGYGDRGWAWLQQEEWQAALADFHQVCTQTDWTKIYCEWVAGLPEAHRSPLVLQNTQFFQALCFQPESAATYFALGQLLARQRDWQKAIATYQQALQNQPESPEILTALGNALVTSNPRAAIDAYQTALHYQPDLPEACLKLGRLLVVQDRDQAVALFQKAIQLQPENAEAYVLLGRWSNASVSEKIALYQQALTLQPDRIDALLNLGYGLAEKGETEAAIEHIQTALTLQPNLYRTIQPVLKSLFPMDSGQIELDPAADSELTPESDLEADPDRLESSETQLLGLCDRPTGFYETTEAWAIQTSQPYIAVDPPGIIPLTLPKGLDHQGNPLRQREAHVSYRFGAEIQLPGTFVATIPQGQFWLSPDQTASAILTAADQILGDLSPEFPLLSPGHPDRHPSLHSLFAVEKRSPRQSLDGMIAVLSGLTNDMYFHWMFDVLPRINLLQRSGIDLAQIDGFVVSHHLPFQQETLLLLNIPEAKILPTEHHSHIQADRLIVPSYPASPAWMPQWVCDWLRALFLGDSSKFPGNDRLYISRRSTANRRVINESEVLELLEPYGFRCVTLEGRSVKEQAMLLANTDIVIAPHGGGLTNIVFCRPGTKVIELFSPNYVYPCYWLVCNLLGFDYYYLTGKTPAGSFLQSYLYPDPRLADIWIDLKELQSILEWAAVNPIAP
jgi:tetratricopeptide (TPR) repeat protein